jgi:hypothetical protein
MERGMKERLKLINPIIESDHLWATSVMPKGIVESWMFPDGSIVEGTSAGRLQNRLAH